MTTISFTGDDAAQVANKVANTLSISGYAVNIIDATTLEVSALPYDPKAGYNDGPGTTQSGGEGGSGE